MSNARIKTLLTELRRALDEAPGEAPDEELRRLVADLDADIHVLLDADTPQAGAAPLRERARQLEARFAADHPGLERFLREIADWLTKMGV